VLKVLFHIFELSPLADDATDFTNRPSKIIILSSKVIFYQPVIWLQISGENCHFENSEKKNYEQNQKFKPGKFQKFGWEGISQTYFILYLLSLFLISIVLSVGLFWRAILL